MNFEVPIKTEKINKDWSARIVEVGNFENFLEGSKEKREFEKNAFLRCEKMQPELDYPKLDNFDIEERENKLVKLKDEILKYEQEKVVAQAYRWKINEKIAVLRMLKATKDGNDRKFAKYNKYIYGEPDPEIFKYELGKFLEAAKKVKDSKQEMIAGAARRILNEFAGFSTDTNLSKENLGIEKLRSLKDEGEFSSYEIAWAFYGALHEYSKNGWNTHIDYDQSSTAVSVSQEKKQVKIPDGRNVKFSKLKSLIAHEIGTHVARRENGERSKLSLLSLGLDRYSKGEEGVATYEEQKILGANDFAGFDGHFAISLATGVDGKKRTFREVFSILRDYYFVNSKKELHDAWRSAQESAWKRCVKTFEGSSCRTPGVCFTKGIVYREGNIGVWNLIKENSQEEKRFMVGKYDPTNPRHIWILEQLGISDNDLETLDK